MDQVTLWYHVTITCHRHYIISMNFADIILLAFESSMTGKSFCAYVSPNLKSMDRKLN